MNKLGSKRVYFEKDNKLIRKRAYFLKINSPRTNGGIRNKLGFFENKLGKINSVREYRVHKASKRLHSS